MSLYLIYRQTVEQALLKCVVINEWYWSTPIWGELSECPFSNRSTINNQWRIEILCWFLNLIPLGLSLLLNIYIMHIMQPLLTLRQVTLYSSSTLLIIADSPMSYFLEVMDLKNNNLQLLVKSVHTTVLDPYLSVADFLGLLNVSFHEGVATLV